MILFYAIYDKIAEKYLIDKNNNLVRCNTIADCYDYLEYILKISIDILCDNIDYKYYRFDLKVADK